MRLELERSAQRCSRMMQQSVLETTMPYLVLGQSDDGGRPIVDTACALHDLIETFHPRGHYSVRAVDDECGPAVHCAFEHKADADRLAATVGAIEIARYESYRSERAFCLNEELARAIRRVLVRRQS